MENSPPDSPLPRIRIPGETADIDRPLSTSNGNTPEVQQLLNLNESIKTQGRNQQVLIYTNDKKSRMADSVAASEQPNHKEAPLIDNHHSSKVHHRIIKAKPVLTESYRPDNESVQGPEPHSQANDHILQIRKELGPIAFRPHSPGDQIEKGDETFHHLLPEEKPLERKKNLAAALGFVGPSSAAATEEHSAADDMIDTDHSSKFTFPSKLQSKISISSKDAGYTSWRWAISGVAWASCLHYAFLAGFSDLEDETSLGSLDLAFEVIFSIDFLAQLLSVPSDGSFLKNKITWGSAADAAALLPIQNFLFTQISSRATQALLLLKLFRLHHVKRLFSCKVRQTSYFRLLQQYSLLGRVLQIIILGVTLAYLLGSLWSLGGQFYDSDFYGILSQEDTAGSSGAIPDVLSTQMASSKKAIVATYFVATTMTTVGLGDYHPTTTEERLAGIGLLLAACMWAAWVFVTLDRFGRSESRNKGRELDRFLRFLQMMNRNDRLPRRLASDIELFFNNQQSLDHQQNWLQHSQLRVRFLVDFQLMSFPQQFGRMLNFHPMKLTTFGGETAYGEFANELLFLLEPVKFDREQTLQRTEGEVHMAYFSVEGSLRIGYNHKEFLLANSDKLLGGASQSGEQTNLKILLAHELLAKKFDTAHSSQVMHLTYRGGQVAGLFEIGFKMKSQYDYIVKGKGFFLRETKFIRLMREHTSVRKDFENWILLDYLVKVYSPMQRIQMAHLAKEKKRLNQEINKNSAILSFDSPATSAKPRFSSKAQLLMLIASKELPHKSSYSSKLKILDQLDKKEARASPSKKTVTSKVNSLLTLIVDLLELAHSQRHTMGQMKATYLRERETQEAIIKQKEAKLESEREFFMQQLQSCSEDREKLKRRIQTQKERHKEKINKERQKRLESFSKLNESYVEVVRQFQEVQKELLFYKQGLNHQVTTQLAHDKDRSLSFCMPTMDSQGVNRQNSKAIEPDEDRPSQLTSLIDSPNFRSQFFLQTAKSFEEGLQQRMSQFEQRVQPKSSSGLTGYNVIKAQKSDNDPEDKSSNMGQSVDFQISDSQSASNILSPLEPQGEISSQKDELPPLQPEQKAPFPMFTGGAGDCSPDVKSGQLLIENDKETSFDDTSQDEAAAKSEAEMRGPPLFTPLQREKDYLKQSLTTLNEEEREESKLSTYSVSSQPLRSSIPDSSAMKASIMKSEVVLNQNSDGGKSMILISETEETKELDKISMVDRHNSQKQKRLNTSIKEDSPRQKSLIDISEMCHSNEYSAIGNTRKSDATIGDDFSQLSQPMEMHMINPSPPASQVAKIEQFEKKLAEQASKDLQIKQPDPALVGNEEEQKEESLSPPERQGEPIQNLKEQRAPQESPPPDGENSSPAASPGEQEPAAVAGETPTNNAFN